MATTSQAESKTKARSFKPAALSITHPSLCFLLAHMETRFLGKPLACPPLVNYTQCWSMEMKSNYVHHSLPQCSLQPEGLQYKAFCWQAATDVAWPTNNYYLPASGKVYPLLPDTIHPSVPILPTVFKIRARNRDSALTWDTAHASSGFSRRRRENSMRTLQAAATD